MMACLWLSILCLGWQASAWQGMHCMPKLTYLWNLGSPLPIASLQMKLSDSSRCHAKPWSALSMLCDGQGVLPESLCMHISQQPWTTSAKGRGKIGSCKRQLSAIMQIHGSGTFRDTKVLCHPLSMVALLYCLPENVLHCWSDACIKCSPFSANCVQRSS